jgi:hypothetical protein
MSATLSSHGNGGGAWTRDSLVRYFNTTALTSRKNLTFAAVEKPSQLLHII